PSLQRPVRPVEDPARVEGPRPPDLGAIEKDVPASQQWPDVLERRRDIPMKRLQHTYVLAQRLRRRRTRGETEPQQDRKHSLDDRFAVTVHRLLPGDEYRAPSALSAGRHAAAPVRYFVHPARKACGRLHSVSFRAVGKAKSLFSLAQSLSIHFFERPVVPANARARADYWNCPPRPPVNT